MSQLRSIINQQQDSTDMIKEQLKFVLSLLGIKGVAQHVLHDERCDVDFCHTADEPAVTVAEENQTPASL